MSLSGTHQRWGYQGCGGPDDVEILQTDVMRFVAILGLCLMVIFALVKALPMNPPDEGPRIEGRDALKREVRALEREARKLQTQLTGLRAGSERARREALNAGANADSAKASLERLSLSLEQAEAQLGETRGEAAKLKRDIQDSGRALSKVRHDLEAAKRKLHQTLSRLEASERALNVNELHGEAASPPPVEPDKPAKKGFTLRFRSDAALNALVQTGRFAFYGLSGDRAWRLTLLGGTPRFVKSKPPGSYYEMHPQTVPSAFVNALKRAVAAFGRESVVWGVTLPPETQTAIGSLMRGGAGGDLVIGDSGEVRLVP